MMRRPVLLAALATAAGAGADTLTVAAAVETALANNYGIRIARNDAAKADNTRLLKAGSVLPTATAQAAVTYAKVEYQNAAGPGPGNSDGWTTSAGGALNWTLFDGFRMFHALRQVEDRARLSETASRHTIESSVVTVLSAYYGVASASSLLEAAGAQLVVSRAQFDRIEGQIEYGRSSRRELLAQQVAVNADSSAVAARELDLTRACHTLNVALGRAPDQPVAALPDTTVDDPRGNAASWYDKARTHNAGLRIEEIRANIAESQLGIARAAFWPVVAANGSVTQYWGDNDYTRTAAGLTATWSVFTGFRTFTAARNAKLDRESAELSAKRVSLELRALVYEQWERLVNASRQVRFEREAISLAEQSLALSEEQYRLGGISDVQFRQAQNALLTARVRYESALYQSKVLAAQLEQLAGELAIR